MPHLNYPILNCYDNTCYRICFLLLVGEDFFALSLLVPVRECVFPLWENMCVLLFLALQTFHVLGCLLGIQDGFGFFFLFVSSIIWSLIMTAWQLQHVDVVSVQVSRLTLNRLGIDSPFPFSILLDLGKSRMRRGWRRWRCPSWCWSTRSRRGRLAPAASWTHSTWGWCRQNDQVAVRKLAEAVMEGRVLMVKLLLRWWRSYWNRKGWLPSC